ncbi:hypothetical protein ACQKDP_11815 [Psychrobacter pacificensis]
MSNRTCERSAVNLCVDMAAAQVHELILGCHQISSATRGSKRLRH